MLAFPLALVLTLAGPVPAPPCADLGPTSTLADQFVCYKEAGRKIVVPGTGFIQGFDGPGCITAVAADRLQLSTCSISSFNRRTVMLPFASIRAVEESPNAPYVTILLVVTVVQNDCAYYNECVVVQPAPPPAAAPAPRTRLIATPRRP